MAIPHKTIARIKAMLVQTLETVEKSYIVLYHLNISTRRSSISSFKEWSDPDETAPQVWESAKEHAQSMGGPQRFQISSYDPQGATDEPIRTCTFVVDQGFTDANEQAGSEPPDAVGIVAQLMRYNNEIFRMHNAATGALTHHLANTVGKQTEQIDKLMSDRMNTIVIMEELMTRKHQREIETEQTKAEIARKDELFNKIMQLGPVAINKIAGQELVRQKNTELEAAVMTFMETVKPSTLDRLADAGILDKQQLILFSTILEQVTKTMVNSEEKKKQTEAGRAAARGESSGT